MKKISILLITMLSFNLSFAQKFMTKTGTIDFISDAPLEKIVGVNKSTACLLDSKTGDLNFVVLIKSFVFEKQLLQEHFNENYMESDKFPKSTFKGKITNLSEINFSKNGEYKALVEGEMTIHGVTKKIKETGIVSVKGSAVELKSKIAAALSDYKIKIPGAVKDKISKNILINIKCALSKI